jgi:hypothetical protein
MGQKLNRLQFYSFINHFATQQKHCLLVFTGEIELKLT